MVESSHNECFVDTPSMHTRIEELEFDTKSPTSRSSPASTTEPVLLGPTKHSLVNHVNTAAANETRFFPNTTFFDCVDELARA